MTRPVAERRRSPIPPAATRGSGSWLAAGVGALCFLNTLGNEFAYDDFPIIRDNPRIRSLANIGSIWLSDWWRPTDPDQEILHRRRDRLYRPLTMYSFALNHAVGGVAPVGYHAANLLLHAAACLLVWRFAQRLLDDPVISHCTALVFAVHPLHVEAVANVVGRAEVLAALLLLAGLLVLLPRGDPPGWTRGALAALLFLAALFSKETAICYVPVALLIMHLAAPRPARRVRRWWLMHTGILLAPLAVYLPLRYVALEHHLLRDSAPHVLLNPLVWADVPHRLLHAFTILGHYARLFVAPVQLSANYGLAVIDPHGGADGMTVLGILTATVTVVALIGYRRPAGTWRCLAALTAVSIASYALISNTVLLIGVSLAERLVYWLSVPVLLGVVLGVISLWRYGVQRGRLSAEMARVLRICGVLLLVALGLRTVVRNMDWHSNRALFEQDVKTYEQRDELHQSAELHQAFANELLWEIARLPESDRALASRSLAPLADKHLKTALRIYPNSPEGIQLRGRTLGMMGDRQLAITYLERASQLGPLDRAAREMLSHLRESTSQPDTCVILREQISTRPVDARLRLEYGKLLLERGEDQAALTELREAEHLAPDDADVLRFLGDAYAARREDHQAMDAYQRALALNPGTWQVHVNLVTLLAERDPAGALRHAEEAYRLQPNESITLFQLANALALNRRFDEAAGLFRRLFASLPTDDPLRPTVELRIREIERQRP